MERRVLPMIIILNIFKCLSFLGIQLNIIFSNWGIIIITLEGGGGGEKKMGGGGGQKR